MSTKSENGSWAVVFFHENNNPLKAVYVSLFSRKGLWNKLTASHCTYSELNLQKIKKIKLPVLKFQKLV